MNDCTKSRNCLSRACWNYRSNPNRPRELKASSQPYTTCCARKMVVSALPHNTPPRSLPSPVNSVVLDRLNPLTLPQQYLPSLPCPLFVQPHTGPTLHPISQPTNT